MEKQKQKKTRKQPERPSAFDQAAKRLSRRDQTAAEMRRYLKGRGYTAEETEEAVALLQEYHYIDDAAYSCRYFSFAFEKNRSRRRAEQELRQKGVSAEDIGRGFLTYAEENGEPDEQALAEEEAKRVLRASEWEDGEVPDKIRGRIARRLASRGFAHSLIYDVLDSVDRLAREIRSGES